MAQHYLPPPPGVHPNHVNPSTQASWSLWLNIFFLVLTTVATGLRLYTRLRISRFPWGADDCEYSPASSVRYRSGPLTLLQFSALCHMYVIDLVLVRVIRPLTLWQLFFVAYIALLLKMPSAGIGLHMWEVPISSLSQGAVYVGVADFIHLALLSSIKMTFLCYYYHYFWLHTPCRRMVIVGMVVVGVAAAAFTTTAAVTAMPSLSPADSRAGEKEIPHAAPLAYGAVDTATNIYILLVPIPCLRQLQLGGREKMKVAALFFLGICACAAGIAIPAVAPRLWSSPDLTWTVGIMCMLGAVEANIGLLCACLLLLPAFLDGHGPKRIVSSITGCFGRTRSDEGPPVSSDHPFTAEITSVTELNPAPQRERHDSGECG
ncbi:GPCR, PTH11-type [Aspergillus terreus]|uniref:GPCR, PTH11-type n=1 Tax=Aspergillus terreus TaxID=33178 RepID=A0A5M3Z9L8_ASPTE|nr:hypothetical protein ATETN484_0010004100 [Aspergillus terreus]GFF18091.1 GPCR, PTH11-type [Aspergillus terreus]